MLNTTLNPIGNLIDSNSSSSINHHQKETSQVNSRTYLVINKGSLLVGSTVDKKLKSSMKEIQQFVSQNIESLDVDQLKLLEKGLDEHLTSLKERVQKLADQMSTAHVPKFAKALAKIAVSIFFKGASFIKKEENQQFANQIKDRIDKQLPYKKTLESNIKAFTKQFADQYKISPELAKKIALLKMEAIPETSKQEVLASLLKHISSFKPEAMKVAFILTENLFAERASNKSEFGKIVSSLEITGKPKNLNIDSIDKAGLNSIISNLKNALKENPQENTPKTEQGISKLENLLSKIDKEHEKKLASLKGAVKKAFENCPPKEISHLLDQLKTNFKDSPHQKNAGFDRIAFQVAWKRFDEMKSVIIEQTTSIKMPSISFAVKSKTEELVFNNYGISSDFVVDLVVDKTKTPQLVQSFSIKKMDPETKMEIIETYQVDSLKFPLVFDPVQKMIFAENTRGARVNYDQVKIQDLGQQGTLMTLCDGCGQNTGSLKASEKMIALATENAAQRFEGVTDSKVALFKQLNCLKEAQQAFIDDHAQIEGDTTFVQAYIKGGVLSAIAVGDAKLFVMRPKENGQWECVDLTKGGRGSDDPTDSGGRICGVKEDSPDENGNPVIVPELAQVKGISFALQAGDIVMVASDGVADCFDPSTLKDNTENLETNMQDVLEGCKTSKEIQQKIQTHLQQKTIEEKIEFMVDNKGKPTHKEGWGKMDNANMGFFTYQGK